MKTRQLIVLAVLGLLMAAVVRTSGRVDPVQAQPAEVAAGDRLDEAVTRLDAWFAIKWQADGVKPTATSGELAIFRRVSLALFGCGPSLEELRAFERDAQPNRLDRWVQQMLRDPRFAGYFARRLGRSLAGVEQGPFIVFRRDQLTDWLEAQLLRDAPWSETASQLIAAEGLWTDSPAANFITVARQENEELDVNKLAGRTVRTFLGQRIDCAQCHDHFFDTRWKQRHFEGLAAWFGQAQVTLGGVTDFATPPDQPAPEYRIIPPGGDATSARIVVPEVPFHPEWLPGTGSRRARLAAWVTHADNRRFERAIANRIWGLMFGRPLHEPVDDLPHPEDKPDDALDLLGREFRARGDRLSTLIRMIVLSAPFQRSTSAAGDADAAARQTSAWAAFPLVRLRPEQVIGSLFQAGRVRSVDQNSHPLIRLTRMTSENEFIEEYGDAGEDELIPQASTIAQMLLRMNGRFSRELGKVDLLTGPAEVLALSPDDSAVIENSFLMCLSRRPEAEELLHFQKQLQQARQAGEDQREAVVEDLFWALFNSPEFAWNH
ncbi:MAG: hypothetical protein RLZZ436_3117 [Planctomycetota bacterium]|jgi:hypothetical protein